MNVTEDFVFGLVKPNIILNGEFYHGTVARTKAYHNSSLSLFIFYLTVPDIVG